jgi:hypothetical protein
MVKRFPDIAISISAGPPRAGSGPGEKIDIATRLQAEMSNVRISVGARDLSLLQSVQTGYATHLASYSMGAGGFSVG